MSEAIAGIHEKLKRSHENILDLQSEVATFFQEGESPITGDEDFKTLIKAMYYRQNPPVPLRFSVLSGEIIHHFRSCLDHIAWQLSSDEYRRDHPNAIEFPVFNKEPREKDDITRYNRKVKGISSPTAIRLIKDSQPYNATDPCDTPLWIIHDMDRFDKHRELAIMLPGFKCIYGSRTDRDCEILHSRRFWSYPPKHCTKAHTEFEVFSRDSVSTIRGKEQPARH